MAKDDYFVLVYKILAYLYACLKSGEKPDLHYLSAEGLGIPYSYWTYIWKYLDGYLYVSPVAKTLVNTVIVTLPDDLSITPDGIEYLDTAEMMKAARNYLCCKEPVPGLYA